MQKPTINTVKVESWNVRDAKNQFGDSRKVVTKVAVRNRLGQFHGATNFRGSVLGK